MILQVTENCWVDLGQVMAVSVQTVFDADNKYSSYTMYFSTSLKPCAPLCVQGVTKYELAQFKLKWIDHVEFMNDQEYKAKQRCIADEARAAKQAEAIAAMGPINVSEMIGEVHENTSGPITEESNENEDLTVEILGAQQPEPVNPIQDTLDVLEDTIETEDTTKTTGGSDFDVLPDGTRVYEDGEVHEPTVSMEWMDQDSGEV